MRRAIPIVLGLVIALTVAMVSASSARHQEQSTRSDFMRQKLDIAKNMLEGLSLENFDLIEKSAKKMKRLSYASEWEVTTVPNLEEYLPQTTEFQRHCDEILKAAQAKNIDAATLGYVRLTTNCVGCHKYVRTNIR